MQNKSKVAIPEVPDTLYGCLVRDQLPIPQDSPLVPHIKQAAQDLEKNHLYQSQVVKAPSLEQGFFTSIVINGLPKMPDALKVEALIKQLILKTLNLVDDCAGIQLQLDEAKNTTGFAIITFKSEEKAREALGKIKNLAIGKIIINSFSFDEVQETLSTPDVLAEMKEIPDKELLYFMNDPKEREQIITRSATVERGFETVVADLFWHNDIQGSFSKVQTFQDTDTEEFFCQKLFWSTTGKYLCSLYESGVKLFGGPNMGEVYELKHMYVSEGKFSPNDTYMATYSVRNQEMVVWNVKTSTKLKVITCLERSVFDQFGWSYDEKFCATIVVSNSKRSLFVYNSVSMEYLPEEYTEGGQKKKRAVSITCDSPQLLKWGNRRSTLCYVCHPDEAGSSKCFVGVMDFPSRGEYRWIDVIFKITSAQIKWEDNDRFLGIYMELMKKKDDIEQVLQIGAFPKNMAFAGVKSQMGVKSENFKDAKERDEIKSFGFDNGGHHFYIIYNHKTTKQKIFEYYSISLEGSTTAIERQDRVESFKYDKVLFSNIENIAVMANRDSAAFYHLNSKTEKFKLKQTGLIKESDDVNSENYMAFDSSGRNLLVFKDKLSKLVIYSAYGKEKFVYELKNVNQVLWRPVKRAPLDEKVAQEIRKGMTQKVIDEYTKRDEELLQEHKLAYQKERQERQRRFMSFLEASNKRWEETRAYRTNVLGFDPEYPDTAVQMTFVDKKEQYEEIFVGRA